MYVNVSLCAFVSVRAYDFICWVGVEYGERERELPLCASRCEWFVLARKSMNERVDFFHALVGT